VTVATSAHALRDWDIEETDFRGPMILHRHPDRTVPAYVVDEVGSWWIAECSECMEVLELSLTSEALA
jgi:hypothetical protein